MKNILLISILSLTLFSCKVYKETYVLHEYPVDWYEELVIPGDHVHLKDGQDQWKCVYYETDTVCWHFTDTIRVYTLLKTEKVKRSSVQ